MEHTWCSSELTYGMDFNDLAWVFLFPTVIELINLRPKWAYGVMIYVGWSGLVRIRCRLWRLMLNELMSMM